MSNLQNAVIGAGAQLHLLHGRFEQIGAGLVNRTKITDFCRPHPIERLRTIGVGLQCSSFKPLLLYISAASTLSCTAMFMVAVERLG